MPAGTAAGRKKDKKRPKPGAPGPLTIPEAHRRFRNGPMKERRRHIHNAFLDAVARRALEDMGYNHGLGAASLRPGARMTPERVAEARRGIKEAQRRVTRFAMSPEAMQRHPQKSSDVRDAALAHLKELRDGLSRAEAVRERKTA